MDKTPYESEIKTTLWMTSLHKQSGWLSAKNAPVVTIYNYGYINDPEMNTEIDIAWLGAAHETWSMDLKRTQTDKDRSGAKDEILLTVTNALGRHDEYIAVPKFSKHARAYLDELHQKLNTTNDGKPVDPDDVVNDPLPF